MRRISAVLASACAALALAGVASSTTFGVADDAGKYAEDGGAQFFNMLTDIGMTENRIAVFWDPANPTTIVDQAFLDRSIPQAMRRGVEVIFAIYPLKARALVDTPNRVQLFTQYAARMAERYAYIRKIICLNEGNQPRFHQPQFDDAGNGISDFVQKKAMTACYDALKAVDPGIDVIAFGLSPRGNDDFDAVSNVSHSPIRFLAGLVRRTARAAGRSRSPTTSRSTATRTRTPTRPLSAMSGRKSVVSTSTASSRPGGTPSTGLRSRSFARREGREGRSCASSWTKSATRRGSHRRRPRSTPAAKTSPSSTSGR